MAVATDETPVTILCRAQYNIYESERLGFQADKDVTSLRNLRRNSHVTIITQKYSTLLERLHHSRDIRTWILVLGHMSLLQ